MSLAKRRWPARLYRTYRISAPRGRKSCEFRCRHVGAEARESFTYRPLGFRLCFWNGSLTFPTVKLSARID